MRSRPLLAALLLALTPMVASGQSTSSQATSTPAAPGQSAPAATTSTPKNNSSMPTVGIAPKAKDGKDDTPLPLTVDADKMERFGKASLVIFIGNVVVRRDNSVQYADRVEVYMDEKGDRVVRTVSTGGVRIITKDCRTGTAQRAEYFDLDQRVVLIGNARVWQDDNVVSGDTITIYVAQDRTVVEGGKQERVKGVFYSQKDGKQDSQKDGKQDGQPAPRRSAEVCKN